MGICAGCHGYQFFWLDICGPSGENPYRWITICVCILLCTDHSIYWSALFAPSVDPWPGFQVYHSRRNVFRLLRRQRHEGAYCSSSLSVFCSLPGHSAACFRRIIQCIDRWYDFGQYRYASFVCGSGDLRGIRRSALCCLCRLCTGSPAGSGYCYSWNHYSSMGGGLERLHRRNWESRQKRSYQRQQTDTCGPF